MIQFPDEEFLPTVDFCDNGHNTIAYTGKNCPVCIREMELFGLRGRVALLEDKIKLLEEIKNGDGCAREIKGGSG